MVSAVVPERNNWGKPTVEAVAQGRLADIGCVPSSKVLSGWSDKLRDANLTQEFFEFEIERTKFLLKTRKLAEIRRSLVCKPEARVQMFKQQSGVSRDALRSIDAR